MQTLASPSIRSRRCRLRAARWVWCIVITVIAFGTFELLLPLLWCALDRVPMPWGHRQKGCWIFVGILAISYILSAPIRFRITQLRYMLLYPPSSWSIPISLLFVAINEKWLHLGIAISHDYGCNLDEVSRTSYLAICTTLAPLIRSFIREWRLRNNEPNWKHQNGSTDSRYGNWITGSEQPIKSEAENLFDHSGLARRIVNRIDSSHRSLALVGQQGCGKSSILNLVKANIRKASPRTLIATVDLWRLQKPQDAPQILLNEIILELDEVTDTVGLRNIPSSYRALAIAEPSGRLQNLFSLVSQMDSVQLLKKLELILNALDIRLVLMIEDADRLPNNFDTTDLARFVWAFRQLDSCFTIIAADLNHTNLDFTKLCDIIERIPTIPVRDVTKVLIDRYRHWTSKSVYSYIDPHTGRDESDKFDLGRVFKYGLKAYLTSNILDTPIRALATLMQTPRMLRHTLRRVDHAWRKLYGEAEIDDLIVMSALRECSVLAYPFILRNFEHACKHIDQTDEHHEESSESRTEMKSGHMPPTLRAEWEKLLQSEQEPSALRQIVDLLGIEQLRNLRSPNPVSDTSPQGVCVDSAPYFSRIVSENIDLDEVRDQRVLRDIADSEKGECQKLVEGLIDCTKFGDQYRAIWYRFSPAQWAHIANVGRATFSALVASYGANIDYHHPALVILSARLSKIQQDVHVEIEFEKIRGWILQRIQNAIPQSLSLMVGIIVHWVDADLFVGDERKQSVRDAALKMTCDQIPTGDTLVAVLSGNWPETLLYLMEGIQHMPERFAVLLFEAAKLNRDLIIPQLAYLVMAYRQSVPKLDPTSGEMKMLQTAVINRERLRNLFDDQWTQVVELLTQYSGSDPLLIEVADSARELHDKA